MGRPHDFLTVIEFIHATRRGNGYPARFCCLKATNPVFIDLRVNSKLDNVSYVVTSKDVTTIWERPWFKERTHSVLLIVTKPRIQSFVVNTKVNNVS